MKNLKLYIVLVLVTISSALLAQEPKKALQQALELEITRNLKNLHLEGMKDPFYIGLDIVDFHVLSIQSSLGALIKSTESPYRIVLNNQILVGDYKDNNLNFSDPKSGGYFFRTSGVISSDNSVPDIQRRLWLLFDKAYKLSAETYESKQSAIKSRTQSDDIAGLADYTAGEKVLIDKPEISLKFNNEKLVQYANEISLAFKPYRYLSNSWVRVVGQKGNIYYANSDGSKAAYPTSVIRLVINAEIQASNGEVFELYQTYHSLGETDLPAKDQVVKDVQTIAETLAKSIMAPFFDDVYNGPVLFEGQAASEAVRKTMFYAKNENLFSARKPIVGGPVQNQQQQTQVQQNKVSTDDRIDKKIAVEGLNVKAKPTMYEFNGIQLVGAYPIDMDGIIPAQETTLIENGVLKNLLCGRIPTAKMKASNGHLRVPFMMPNPIIVPSVIEVDFTNSVSKEDLKKKLMEMAKADGLGYALIVREMTPNMSELKKVYKVDVNTGAEQLIRSAGFNGLTLNDLRKIVGAGNQKIVLNTTAGEDLQHKFEYLSGSPATFITPDAFLFKDIEVNKVSKPNMAKLPVVKNPLEL